MLKPGHLPETQRASAEDARPRAVALEHTLASWRLIANGASAPDVALRLARGNSGSVSALAPTCADPLARALLGLEPPPDPAGEPDLGRAVRAALAWAELDPARLDPKLAAAIEARAVGSLEWWVPAARAHALCSPAREREARRALAAQDLPYVAPGALHPVQVDVLAVGDRLLEALHVDHVRRLTTLVCEALVLDARALGLWFWPVLRSLSADRVERALVALPSARRLPPGARGLAAAYLGRIGLDAAPALREAGPLDQLLFALAAQADRSG